MGTSDGEIIDDDDDDDMEWSYNYKELLSLPPLLSPLPPSPVPYLLPPSPVPVLLSPPLPPPPVILFSPLFVSTSPSPASLPKPEWPLSVYSQLQLELPKCMKCPLLLPHWLIQSMKQVRDMNECPPPPPGPAAKKKKAIPTHTDCKLCSS